MSWKVYGNQFATADLTSPLVSQAATFVNDSILLAMQTWLIGNNDPTITDLSMKIYSDRGGAPGKLLHTSNNVITKTHLMEDPSGSSKLNSIKAVTFTFDSPVLKGGTAYHYVIQGTGYTYSAGSHVAWYKAFPKPPYYPGFTVNANSPGRAPYFLVPISSRL